MRQVTPAEKAIRELIRAVAELAALVEQLDPGSVRTHELVARSLTYAKDAASQMATTQ